MLPRMVLLSFVRLGASVTQEAMVAAERPLIPALDLQGQTLSDVTRSIEETANVNVPVDRQLRERTIDLQLQTELPWCEALRVLAWPVDGQVSKPHRCWFGFEPVQDSNSFSERSELSAEQVLGQADSTASAGPGRRVLSAWWAVRGRQGS